MAETLDAAEICSRIVAVTELDTPLPAAAQRRREQPVGCLVVVGATASGQRVVGMLTDRDIVTRVIAKAVDPSTLRVEDVMNAEAVTARESDAFAEILAEQMRTAVQAIDSAQRRERNASR